MKNIKLVILKCQLKNLIRIPNCKLAAFSKLKYLNASNFVKFRETFKAKFLNGFLAPADTFDNVKGQFPIGFLIWDLSKKVSFKKITLDVFNDSNEFIGKKQFYSQTKENINKWIKKIDDKTGFKSALLDTRGNDFQNQQYISIKGQDFIITAHSTGVYFTANNLISISIYFAVRHAIKATWLNDRDQFLSPNDEWQEDSEFQNDCLAFTLFHSQNKIQSKEGQITLSLLAKVKWEQKEPLNLILCKNLSKAKSSQILATQHKVKYLKPTKVILKQ